MKLLLYISCFFIAACTPGKKLPVPQRSFSAITGTAFYQQAGAFGWEQRDSFALQEILQGNIPSFLKRFIPVTTEITGADGKKIKAVYFVSADYVSIGSDADWARIPLTAMAAQKLAVEWDCFLPTRKMVDDIYQDAKLKLAPVPMFAYRDSTPTMYQHHLIIEGQRRGRKGLIAGIKKDVVMSAKIANEKKDKVAIYGWHKLDGKPIQPLYAGHVNWYVDYSHGIRLVHRQIKIDNKWMDYTDVLKDPLLQKLLCDEKIVNLITILINRFGYLCRLYG